MADTASTTSDASHHTCHYCEEPAKLICVGCKGCPSATELETNSIYYCSKKCQKDDWDLEHKAACKSRVYKRSLYRAANLAQEMFYELREKTFDDRIISVSDEGDILRITNQTLGNHVIYHDFPDMSALSPEDKATVLTYCTCNVAMAAMSDTVTLLFRGQRLQQTYEIECDVLGCPRQAFFDPPGVGAMHFKHSVWRILDKEDDYYILDLASAQFGHYKPLTYLRWYEEAIDFQMTRCKDFGFERAGGADGHNGCSGDPVKLISQELFLAHGIFMAKKLALWEEKNMSFAKILRLPQPAFEETSVEIVRTAKMAIETSFESYHKDMLIRRYGCSLVRDHDWTKAGIHPYKGEIYAQDLYHNMTPLKARLDAMRLELDFRMKKYDELNNNEKKAVDHRLNGEAIHKDSYFTLSKGVFVHRRGKPVTIQLA